MGLERSTALFRDPANRAGRLIPLLLSECKLPEALGRFKHVDYRKSSTAEFEKLVRQLKGGTTRRKNAPSPLEHPLAPFQPVADRLGEWRREGNTWHSAPASVFLGGEHSVVFGHPAIYLPLPLRLHALVLPIPRRAGIDVEFFVRDPSQPDHFANVRDLPVFNEAVNLQSMHLLDQLYPKFLARALRPWKGSTDYGFSIKIVSEFPLACGLDSSGAICACVARALLGSFLNPEKFAKYSRLKDANERELAFHLGWMLENCFHAGRSSGAGVAAAMRGRLGRHPLIYFTERRTRLRARMEQGWPHVDAAIMARQRPNWPSLLHYVFDPGESRQGQPAYPEPPEYHLSTYFCGTTRRAGNVLTWVQPRAVGSDLRPRVKRVISEVLKTFGDANQHALHVGEEHLHSPLQFHANEILRSILLQRTMNDVKRQTSCGRRSLSSRAKRSAKSVSA